MTTPWLGVLRLYRRRADCSKRNAEAAHREDATAALGSERRAGLGNPRWVHGLWPRHAYMGDAGTVTDSQRGQAPLALARGPGQVLQRPCRRLA